MNEPETVEFVLHGTVAGQTVSATKGLPFTRFLEFNEDVQKYVQGSDEKAVLRDLTVQVHESSYLLRVIIPAGLLASLISDTAKLSQSSTLADIDPHRAKVALRWQERAKMETGLSYTIRSPREAFKPLEISKDSVLQQEERIPWVSVERYLVGKITDWGGSKKPNIHLRPNNSRETLIIDATEDQIRTQRDNLVYHKAIVQVRAQQNPRTGELQDYRLVELRAYQPETSDERLQQLFERGTKAWADVPNATAWVNEQRGADDYG